jgi:CubicO group peptidase (beta-lactamase class C family)
MRQGKIPAFAALLLVAGCGQMAEIRETAPIAGGLVARTLCTAIFVQGRTEADVRAVELGPDTDDRLRFVSAAIDHERGEVAARVVGRTIAMAGHTPGLGCAVGRPGRGPGQGPAWPQPDPRPWPAGDGLSPAGNPGIDRGALESAVADAFRPGIYGDPGRDPHTRAVVIVHGGRLIVSRHAPGFGPTVPQYSASMSKTVAGALAGLMVADGRIGLDDDRLLPGWTDRRAAITLAHLLDMESGLAFEETYGATNDPARMLYAEASAAGFAADRPLREPPGTRWYYSSGETNILMRVLRGRSGRDDAAWARWPREALFAPLNMRSTLFETDAAGDFLGSTFVHASAHDWARFGLMLADGGIGPDGARILPAEWVARMRTPTALSRGRYATQTWLRGGDPAGTGPAPILELRGYGGQFVTIVPETRTVIVKLGYQPDRPSWQQDRFLARILPVLGIPLPPEGVEQPDPQPDPQPDQSNMRSPQAGSTR